MVIRILSNAVFSIYNFIELPYGAVIITLLVIRIAQLIVIGVAPTSTFTAIFF